VCVECDRTVACVDVGLGGDDAEERVICWHFRWQFGGGAIVERLGDAQRGRRGPRRRQAL
jgi:hypothetical protein